MENLKMLVPYNEFIGDLTNPDTHLVEVVEEWKDIIGHNGKYKISSFGRVFNVIKNYELPYRINHKGYYRVELCRKDYPNGKKAFFVHRLVGIHFIENPENKPQINHKYCVKTSNHFWKIEWATNSENQIHAFKHGLNKPRFKNGYCAQSDLPPKRENRMGVNNTCCKLTEKQVIDIFKSNQRGRDLSKMYNIQESVISSIRNRRTWKHITNSL